MNPRALELPIRLNAPLRFTEADALAANAAWGFNCGPAALCAVLSLTPEELRPHMLDFGVRRYTNPTLMNDVLDRLGMGHKYVFRSDADPGRLFALPKYGVVRIQFNGPWMKPGVPVAARYQHTHWIGCRHTSTRAEVFDINALDRGGWVCLTEWTNHVVPEIVAACEPKSDGHWWPTHGVEVWV